MKKFDGKTIENFTGAGLLQTLRKDATTLPGMTAWLNDHASETSARIDHNAKIYWDKSSQVILTNVATFPVPGP